MGTFTKRKNIEDPGSGHTQVIAHMNKNLSLKRKTKGYCETSRKQIRKNYKTSGQNKKRKIRF